jgi:hypothetical protein
MEEIGKFSCRLARARACALHQCETVITHARGAPIGVEQEIVCNILAFQEPSGVHNYSRNVSGSAHMPTNELAYPDGPSIRREASPSRLSPIFQKVPCRSISTVCVSVPHHLPATAHPIHWCFHHLGLLFDPRCPTCSRDRCCFSMALPSFLPRPRWMDLLGHLHPLSLKARVPRHLALPLVHPYTVECMM